MAMKPTHEELEQRATDSNLTGEALRESKAKMRNIFLSAPVGIGVVRNRVFLDVNDRLSEVTGYTRDELIGKNARILYPTDADYEYVGREKYKKIERLGTGAVETRFKCKDGEIIDVLLSSTPIDPSDLSAGVTFTALDITDRKMMEEALRESEDRFRDLYENAPIAYFSVTVDGRIRMCNRRAGELLNYTVDELEGRSVLDLYADTEQGKEKAVKILQRFRVGENIRDEELQMKRADEVPVWISLTVNPVRDAQGRVMESRSMVLDITKRKQMEQELKESEEKYRKLFETAMVGIFRTRIKDGKVLLANETIAKVMGYESAEAFIEEYVTSKHYADLGRREVLLNQLRSDGKVDGFEIEMKGIDGSNIHVALSATAYPNRGYMEGIIIDITDRKRMEEELRQLHKMEAIGTLAGGIAHDFNNILGVILGNAELAMNDVPEWNTAHSNLEEIKKAGLRAKDVIRQLLSFSRKAEQERRSLMIAPLIKESVKFLRSTIPSSIEIRQNTSVYSDTILGDPTQIHQVMINLCTNAAHAMEEEGGIMEIDLTNVQLDESEVNQYQDLKPGQYVILSVSDTGSGIPPEIMDRLFDPYFTTKDVGKGSGMGLSVVHGIVKRHKGAISIESKIGTGTTVHVLFPVVEAAEEKIRDEIPKTIPRGNERILFVDDEKAIVQIGQSMLERLGYQCESKTSPVEVLELFQSNPNQFDLIITDMTMPQITGDKLSERIMKIRSDIPIILCTGYSDKIDEVEAKDIGIDAFLMKPLLVSEVAKTIREVLDDRD